MRLNIASLCFALLTAGLAGPATARPSPGAQAPVRYDRAFWIALKDAGFAVPPGADPAAILRESESLLADRDPVLRDDVAYGLAVAWIYRERRVSDADIRAMADRLRQNLASRESGDEVLRRSFSALVLSIVAAADSRAPVFDDAGRAALLDAAVAFVRDEPDTRGYDASVGWVHATAHGADLLKFLARGPGLPRASQERLAQTLVDRVSRPAPVFVWGEDGRLADALRALVLRADFDPVTLDRWLASLGGDWKALWSAPALDTSRYARLTNARHVLASLYAGIAATEDAPEGARAFAARVLDALSEMR